MAESRKLARPVFAGGVTYAAGTAEQDIPEEHRELIQNPKAWDAEAAAAVGNVAVGPTTNYVAIENPLPRAESKAEQEQGDKPAATAKPAPPAKSAAVKGR